MNAKQAEELRENPELLKRLTKYIALHAFRNTELENLHAGKVPRTAVGDFSDVKVNFPSGEIPWTALSRFDNAEMKALMIDVVNHTYVIMFKLFGGPDTDSENLLSALRQHGPQPKWD